VQHLVVGESTITEDTQGPYELDGDFMDENIHHGNNETQSNGRKSQWTCLVIAETILGII